MNDKLENNASMEKVGFIAKTSLKENLLDRVKVLYSDLEYVWGNCNSLSKWDSWEEFQRNLDLLKALYPRVAACVEYCANEIKEETRLLCTSAEKKAAAKQFIDDMVKLSGVGEFVSDLFIDWGVDAAVAALNAKFGKDWGVTTPNAVAQRAAAVLSTPRAVTERDGR